MSTLKVDTITDSSSGLTTTINGFTPKTDNMSGRNLIINGAMNIWQRGTTVTLTSNDNTNYHTADRWGQYLDIDEGSGSLSVTISQSTDVPSTESFSYSLKAATTPSSFVPSGSDNIALFTHKIETYNANPLGWGTSGAKAATLSYWIKSDTAGTGTLQIRLQDSSNVSGQGDGNYYTSFTINQANTWEYKTHLIPANSTDGWRRTVSNIALHIHWFFGSEQTAAGTQDAWYRENNHGRPHSSQTLDFMTNAGEAYLTGVQLEVGDIATPFEHRSYGEELQLCHRYYQDYTNNTGSGIYLNGTNEPSSEVLNSRFLPVVMRASPAVISASSTSGTVGGVGTDTRTLRYFTASGHTSGGFSVQFALDSEL